MNPVIRVTTLLIIFIITILIGKLRIHNLENEVQSLNERLESLDAVVLTMLVNIQDTTEKDKCNSLRSEVLKRSEHVQSIKGGENLIKNKIRKISSIEVTTDLEDKLKSNSIFNSILLAELSRVIRYLS